MEWDRFKKTLGQGQPDQVKLKLLLDETRFIVDFLSRLLEHLGQCQTHEEITAQYPEASSVLTLASNHPFLTARPYIARLLVSCLLEYSKFQYAEEGQTLEQHGRSISWCIARVRRLVNMSTEQYSESLVERRVERISEKVDHGLSSGTVSLSRIHELLDMAMFLKHEKPIAPLIQKLVQAAVQILERRNWSALTPHSDDDDDNDNENDMCEDDIQIQLLPRSFLIQICERDNVLWTMYRGWPHDLKFKLWKHHPEIIRTELMDLLDNYAAQTTFISGVDLSISMVDSEVAFALMHERAVARMIFKTMAELLLQYGDWRIYRVWRQLVSVTAYQFIPAGLEDINKIALATAEVVQDARTALTRYIYGDRIQDMRLRRGQAWLWVIVHPEWIYPCTQRLVDACFRGNTHFWNQDVEAGAGLLCWLLCPSDDDRFSDTQESFRLWLHTLLQGANANSITTMRNVFCGSLETTFCGNLVVALCMIMSVLARAPALSDQEYINMLDAALSISRPKTTTITITAATTTATPRLSVPGFFLFLDLVPLWKKSSATWSSTLDTLIDHVDDIVQQQR